MPSGATPFSSKRAQVRAVAIQPQQAALQHADDQQLPCGQPAEPGGLVVQFDHGFQRTARRDPLHPPPVEIREPQRTLVPARRFRERQAGDQGLQQGRRRLHAAEHSPGSLTEASISWRLRAMPPAPVARSQVKAVRAFNRFYTQRIGILRRYLDTDFTLTEVRVLYELAHRPPLTARELVRDLELDAGYLSRILRRFEDHGWLLREPAPHDARQSLLRLTGAGYATFAPLQQKSRDEAAELLAGVAPAARPRLIGALQTVQRLLEPPPAAKRKVVLRDPRPGDIGWVVQMHGELYAREYGFDAEFEALVAEIAAKYIRHFDPEHEKGWIAEVDGERAGCVFLVRKSATVAQLRLLLLRPEARGLGVGGKLTDACIAFAQAKGYRRMMLWTQSNLTAARAIYQSRGFVLKQSDPNEAFGQQLVSEIWERRL